MRPGRDIGFIRHVEEYWKSVCRLDNGDVVATYYACSGTIGEDEDIPLMGLDREATIDLYF